MVSKRFSKDRFIFGVSFNVLVLGVVSLFADMSTEMIYPLIPLFLVNVLGASFIDVGIIEGIAESTASIFKIVSGYISDKFKKRKPLVYLGYGISVIAKPLLALTTAWQQVLGLRFIDRLGKGVRDSARDAIISESGGVDVGRSFGFQRALDTLGAVIGPLIAASLFIYLSYRGLFLLAFIPGLFATLLVVFFVKDAAVGIRDDREYQISFRSFDRNFKILLVGLSIFFIGNSSDAFLFLRAQNLGIAALFIPVLYLISNLVYALASFPFGILSDKIGRKRVLLLGYGMFFIVYLGFALANAPIIIWMLFPVYGLYYGLTDGVSKALVSDLAPKTLKATAFGTYYTIIGIVALPASLIAGTLWQMLGPPYAFFYGAAMSTAAIITIGLFVKKD
jgi:MFS family permease